MTDQTMQFQAEVAKLLHIVTHSLYSEKEIFLRELISNASDACDKLRYAALTQGDLLAEDSELRVRIVPDAKAGTLTISDNGIGMNRDDLVENLGTIARSGTEAFSRQLEEAAKAAQAAGKQADDKGKAGTKSTEAGQLIGQFGVGFYSAFMVADKVTVTSRKAGDAQGWRWESEGTGSYTIGEAEDLPRGTSIQLHIAKAQKEFLEPTRLRTVIKTYSDHISLPVILVDPAKGEEEEGREEQVNAAGALWTRPKSEIGEEQYREFYHHVGRAFDDPWLTVHAHVEGKLDFTLLLFVPSRRPFDLFDPDRRHGVKLFVRRVFITDDCEGLVPPWLRFLRGVVDSADLPLNVSREMLQNNPLVAKIRSTLQKRVLRELERKAEKEPDAYAEFWDSFGPVLKEGLYEDREARDSLLKLARFQSSEHDGLISLADYVAGMKEGQEAIYTISGESLEALRRSPQLEGFRAKGVDVLLLTDAVDDFWQNSVPDFDGKPFRSITRGNADLGAIKGKTADAAGEDEAKAEKVEGAALGTLIAALKQSLGEAVKDVRETDRLTDSAVCLVAGDADLDMHLARMLKQHQRLDEAPARILEINPGHPLIRRLADRAGEAGGAEALEDAAHLLLDQARILEGESLPDPAAFARRLTAVMTQGVA
ncbi:MAG: molecular chaperone HtpG [Sneathiellaceae bacterium]